MSWQWITWLSAGSNHTWEDRNVRFLGFDLHVKTVSLVALFPGKASIVIFINANSKKRKQLYNPSACILCPQQIPPQILLWITYDHSMCMKGWHLPSAVDTQSSIHSSCALSCQQAEPGKKAGEFEISKGNVCPRKGPQMLAPWQGEYCSQRHNKTQLHKPGCENKKLETPFWESLCSIQQH